MGSTTALMQFYYFILQLQFIIDMAIVQKANYIPNTLRKGRVEAFQTDIERVFNRYNEYAKSISPEELTMTIFSQIWTSMNMQYIFQCLCEEESEDQFAQLLYEIVLKKYFIFKSKPLKVFALYSLYFLYYACQNRKRINISYQYIQQLNKFLLENRNDSNSHYMKISYQLHQKCFNLCTKIGLRNPIVKVNGQLSRRAPIVKTDPIEHIARIQEYLYTDKNDNMKSLREILGSYSKLKSQIKDATYNKQKFPSDIYFATRIERSIKSYKQFLDYVQKDRKKQEERE